MRFSELEGARVGVWGAGREIASFAGQLARRLPSASLAVAAFDGPAPAGVRATLHAPALVTVEAAGALEALSGCDVVVRSPGVSIHRPELRALAAAGVPITTATALWLAERGGRGVVGVTGTKGKSTTAALLAHVGRAGGTPIALAGNIGVPALDLLDADPAPVAVVELSSYQIADLACAPEVVVFTNLYREHADWHGGEAAYRADKLRILALPGLRTAVVNGRDSQLVASSASAPAVTLYGVREGWDVVGGGLSRRGEAMLDAASLPLAGEHNALNLCGALTAIEAAGIALPPLGAALAGFEPLAHRLEPVAELDGVLWVNDSISTTPESTLAALASFPGRPAVVIGGGQDRGQDYGPLAAGLASAGAGVIGVPSTGARLVAAARAAGVPDERAVDAEDLDGAVARARAMQRPGGVVLLSPAAPSYDHYRDFEQRGERFRALLAHLAGA